MASDEQRAPHVAEPLFFVGDGERDVRAENAREDLHSAWRLTEPSEGSPYAATIKDSTREAVRSARARGLASPQVGRGRPRAVPRPRRTRRRARAATPARFGAGRVGVHVPDADQLRARGRVDGDDSRFRPRHRPRDGRRPSGFCSGFGSRGRSVSLAQRALGVHEEVPAGAAEAAAPSAVLQRPQGSIRDPRGKWWGGTTAADDARDVAATRAPWRPGGSWRAHRSRSRPSTDPAAADAGDGFRSRSDDETAARGWTKLSWRRQRSSMLPRRRAATRPMTGAGKAAALSSTLEATSCRALEAVPRPRALLVRRGAPRASPGDSTRPARHAARTPQQVEAARPGTPRLRRVRPRTRPCASPRRRCAAATHGVAALAPIRLRRRRVEPGPPAASSRGRSFAEQRAVRAILGGSSRPGSPRQTHVDSMDVGHEPTRWGGPALKPKR